MRNYKSPERDAETGHPRASCCAPPDARHAVAEPRHTTADCSPKASAADEDYLRLDLPLDGTIAEVLGDGGRAGSSCLGQGRTGM